MGVEVRIERVDFNTLISRVFGANRPDLFVLFSEWIYSAPELILACYDSQRFPNPNMFGYANPAVDEILRATTTTSARESLNNLCREIEIIAGADAPAVWLFHSDNVYIMAKPVTNFKVNGHNHWEFTDVRMGQ
jgi:ABC-type transport system substrate-binding protein